MDVGAGDGSETGIFAEAVGPQGRVYAVEAHPATFRRLQKAVRLNGWGNVVPVQAAIVGEPGVVYIEDRQKDLSNAISLNRGGGFQAEVSGVTLDGLCRDHGIDRIDFLKMNIEGAERAALVGMGEAIKRVRCAAIACHDFRAPIENDDSYATKSHVIRFLRSRGFTVHTRDGHPRSAIRDHVHALRAVLGRLEELAAMPPPSLASDLTTLHPFAG